MEIQQASAAVLQQWGVEAESIEKLDQAIRGAVPQASGKNLVWGWLKLSTIADQARRRAAQEGKKENEKRYTDLFFEARYNAAQSRFATAELSTGTVKAKYLKTARRSVESMQKLYPDMGGPKWKKAYSDLLEQMK